MRFFLILALILIFQVPVFSQTLLEPQSCVQLIYEISSELNLRDYGLEVKTVVAGNPETGPMKLVIRLQRYIRDDNEGYVVEQFFRLTQGRMVEMVRACGSRTEFVELEAGGEIKTFVKDSMNNFKPRN
jgi:hypothetical protein